MHNTYIIFLEHAISLVLSHYALNLNTGNSNIGVHTFIKIKIPKWYEIILLFYINHVESNRDHKEWSFVYK